MAAARDVPRYLRQLANFELQLGMPHCVMVKTGFKLLRRRHPKVKKEVAMHRSREENIQHLSGEVRAVREEEIEVCQVRTIVQPFHEPLILSSARLHMNANNLATV